MSSSARRGQSDPTVAALEAELQRLNVNGQAPRAPDGAELEHEHGHDDSSSSSSDSSLGHPEDLHPEDGARAGPPETKAPTAALPSDARVGLLYDQSMELHIGPDDHVERPSRIIALHARLEEEGLMRRCWQLPPRKATDEELLRAHTAEHIRQVDTMFERLYPERPLLLRGERYCYADGSMGDVYVCAATAGAARMAAGCCVQAALAVLSGAVQRCLAVVRPPGHHAECERAMGFCYFNNVAAAALAALGQPGVKRVAVLDWDVHHGNGIQHILYDRPDALYISLHRDPKHFYPYTSGFVGEAGRGPGTGFNVNIPWARRGVGDGDYMAAFSLIVEPILTAYAPDLIIVAAGYDAAEGDPLGGCKLSPGGYAWMTERLLRFAGGRVVLALEGGYNNRVTAWCAAACTTALLRGAAEPPLPRDREHCWPSDAHDSLKLVYEFQQPYWPVLAARSWEQAWEEHVQHVTKLMGPEHSRPKRQPSGAASGAAAAPGRAAGGGAVSGVEVQTPQPAAPAAVAEPLPPTLQEAFLARKAAREAAAAAVNAAAAAWAVTGAGGTPLPPPDAAAAAAAPEQREPEPASDQPSPASPEPEAPAAPPLPTEAATAEAAQAEAAPPPRESAAEAPASGGAVGGDAPAA